MTCQPDELPDGETCAAKEEALEYFSGMSVMVTSLNNYVDYEVVKDVPIDQVLRI